jgi:D-threo-aldose 1-dehydrogenase
MPLTTRPLGRTGVPVTVMGFGSAPLGDLYAKLHDQTAIDTVEAALKGGITLFDTSPHYGNGLAEHRCGTALRRVPRSQFVISTKIGRVMDPRARPSAATSANVESPGFAGGLPHKANFDYSRDGMLRAFEQSLLRLGLDRLDIVLIHDVDVWTHGREGYEQRFREAMEGAYPALEELRREGVVKAIGVGVNESDVCERFVRAGDFDTVLLAGRYSLLEQPAFETFLPLAEQKGVGVMLGGVFNSGILATGPVEGARYNYRPAPPEIMERVRRIETICKAHGVALADAALHFPLGHPAVSSLVLGAVAPSEIARNLKTFEVRMPAGLWSDLKSEGLLDSNVPTPA